MDPTEEKHRYNFPRFIRHNNHNLKRLQKKRKRVSTVAVNKNKKTSKLLEDSYQSFLMSLLSLSMLFFLGRLLLVQLKSFHDSLCCFNCFNRLPPGCAYLIGCNLTWKLQPANNKKRLNITVGLINFLHITAKVVLSLNFLMPLSHKYASL